MSRYPSNTDHYKRRSGKGRRRGRGYGQNCWQQRNQSVYAYNHGYGDNRYEYEPHLAFQNSWEEDILRWLQPHNTSWNNQRVGNNWQLQNRMHHGANSCLTLRPVNYINSTEHSQNNCDSSKVNNASVSTGSKKINEKPVSAAQQPPPPGSEEARLEAVANTTDKLRQYLFSNRNKSTEVLQTLLEASDSSADPNGMKESSKNANIDIPVPQPDLPPSPTDWQKICMSSRPKSPTNSLLVDDDDVVFVAKPIAETVSIDSDDSISGDVSVINHKIKTETSDSSLSSSNPISDTASKITCSNVQDSSGNLKEKPNNLSPDSALSLLSAENENPVGSLKQNVIRQLLKMGSASIKDIVNNPTSRKFQYALKHLVREHKVAWTRQLRVLAETRIQNRNRELINHEHLLDSDIAVNISNLPQEFIEQLGDLLKMDLFDTVDFQETNTDDAEQGLRDLELLCSEVTQEAEKAFHASKNSNQENLVGEIVPGQINSSEESKINLTQNDTFKVPNIKHEKVDSDVNLSTANNTNTITKYSVSATLQKNEELDSEHPNLEKVADDRIGTSVAKTYDSWQNPLSRFQPIETGESGRKNRIVKNCFFDHVNQRNSSGLQNSNLPKNNNESRSEIDKVFTITNIPNPVTQGKEDCTQSSKVRGISMDEGLNVNFPISSEGEISEQAENSRDSNSIPEQTLGNVAHSSTGDSDAVKLSRSQEISDYQSVISSKRICTPAAKKCYNFSSLGVGVCTQTEPSSRKVYPSEIISELETVYSLPVQLTKIVKEYLEPKNSNVSKPQSERPVLTSVSKSLYNKLDSNGTSDTYLPPPHFEQRTSSQKSTVLSDTCSAQVNNKEASQVVNQSTNPHNQAELNIQMYPDSINLPCKGSVISSSTNINSDVTTVHERIYLKMLDIDCKIQQLMGMKTDLYKQLQMSFLSQKGNHLNSRTSYENFKTQAENLRTDHGENNSNGIRECGGIMPISGLENPLNSDTLTSQTIPSHRIDSNNKIMSSEIGVIPNCDNKGNNYAISDLENPLHSDTLTSQTIPSHRIVSSNKSISSEIGVIPNCDNNGNNYAIHTLSQTTKVLGGGKSLHTNSNLPKPLSIDQNNQVNQPCVVPVVGNSNSSSVQSFKNSNSRKKSKKRKRTRNKKKALTSISLLPVQNMPVSEKKLGEMYTDINIDNDDKSVNPGARKRSKVSSRELQALKWLLNEGNECTTVANKSDVSDSDVETNNLGRTRRQRYSLLDENLLENQMYNMDTNRPNIDHKRKCISMCDSEVTNSPCFKKIRSESPQLPIKQKETENVCGTLNMNSEVKQEVVFSGEFPQNKNAHKLCQLTVSVASVATVKNDSSIKTANKQGSPSVSEQGSTTLRCTNVTNFEPSSETCSSLRSEEESQNSNANSCPCFTVGTLSKIRNCSVRLERLPEQYLYKADATSGLEDRSETLTNFSIETERLENVPNDRDEDTNSVSSISGGGTPRRLCGPDDGGEVEVRNHFVGHKGSILDLQCIGRLVLAACEDGCVYCYSLKSGKLKRTLQCSETAVTCLCISDSASLGLKFIFCGSLDGYLRCFTFETGDAVNEPIYVGSGIQCIDHNWGNIYIGTKDGSVKVFNCKKFEILSNYFKCSKDSIFTIRTTKEGPRKVMLIGSRSQPVIVRDSATGLYLRSVTKESNFTVYSILLDSSLVYCGTSIGTIPVYNFTNGEEVFQLSAGTGVVCLKIYNDLLFAGCYDGFIYIFNIQSKNLITKVSGSGKMILSMEIAKNRIICSSKDKTLEVWNFPLEVRKYLKDTKHR